MSLEDLIQLALDARRQAYCPYSNFQVGVALQNQLGQTAMGCNVENAAYGSTICAEANALGTAVAQGLSDITDLVIATSSGAAPCGNCRQLIAELAPNSTIHLVNLEGTPLSSHSIRELLPSAFTSLD